MPPKQLSVFHEMAVDFNKEIFVGVAAANLSKRPFQASSCQTSPQDPGRRGDIVAKPVKDVTKLLDTGIQKLADGTYVIEGACLRVATPQNAPVTQQANMGDYKGEWSDNRQLLWNNDKTGKAPVARTAGRHHRQVRDQGAPGSPQAPDYAILPSLKSTVATRAQQRREDRLLLPRSPAVQAHVAGDLLAEQREAEADHHHLQQKKNPKSSGYHSSALDEKSSSFRPSETALLNGASEMVQRPLLIRHKFFEAMPSRNSPDSPMSQSAKTMRVRNPTERHCRRSGNGSGAPTDSGIPVGQGLPCRSCVTTAGQALPYEKPRLLGRLGPTAGIRWAHRRTQRLPAHLASADPRGLDWRVRSLGWRAP